MKPSTKKRQLQLVMDTETLFRILRWILLANGVVLVLVFLVFLFGVFA